MAPKLPAKSVSKQTEPTPTLTLSDQEQAQAERAKRNLTIALHHAGRIQHQKDIQAQILSNIETLIDFPATNEFKSSEASTFVSLVQVFQPSDFDSLVEERRIDGKCGYALCANAPRSVTMGSSAAWKLKGRGAQDYCSNDCLKQALYVKSQLSEVPAWQREPGQQPHIILYEGDHVTPSTLPEIAPRKGSADQYARSEELAMERGEDVSSFRPGQVMTSNVVEKPVTSHKSPIRTKHTDASHTAIEGYEPTLRFKQDSQSANTEPDLFDELGAGNSSLGSEDPGADTEEREAWRDLFDNIDKR